MPLLEGPDGAVKFPIQGKTVFNLSKTLVIGPLQDQVVDLSGYIFNWLGRLDEDAIVIESAMNSVVKIHAAVYGGRCAAVRLRPSLIVPKDNVACITESRIQIATIATPTPMQAINYAGTGLYLDSGSGPIVNNLIEVDSTVNMFLGIGASENGHGIRWNDLRLMNGHSAILGTYLLNMGFDFRDNFVRACLGYDNTAGPFYRVAAPNRLEIIER